MGGFRKWYVAKLRRRNRVSTEGDGKLPSSTVEVSP
jgi:hypothetical protein